MIRLRASWANKGLLSRLLSTTSLKQTDVLSHPGLSASEVEATPLKEADPAVVPSDPILRKCSIAVPKHLTPVQAWVESLKHYDARHLGLIDLHPDVFAVMPRLDILHAVAIWQKNFKRISYAKTKTRAEDDLHIVDSLEIPTSDPQYLIDLAQYRHWGRSVLIADVNEIPENLLAATSRLKTITVLPAIGLNVHSMLKYDTLVLTLDTVDFLEKKLLWHDMRYGALYPFRLPYSDFP